MKSKPFQLIIAIDGSTPSETICRDMHFAGLPKKGEALVVSVADAFIPTARKPLSQIFLKARLRALGLLRQSQAISKEYSQKIKTMLPGWKTKYLGIADNPAWAIIKQADRLKPDLIVVGSHDRSFMGALLLGSVSQKVLSQAKQSVRIVRDVKEGTIPKVLVTLDASQTSEKLLKRLMQRAWPKGTQLYVLMVFDSVLNAASQFVEPPARKWMKSTDAHPRAWVQRYLESVSKKLAKQGFSPILLLREGDARKVILHEAKQWKVNSIWIGARGLSGIERFILGSVSSFVSQHAKCTVEVVR